MALLDNLGFTDNYMECMILLEEECVITSKALDAVMVKNLLS